MGRRIATSFVPVAAALAAFFLVLPTTGADATVRVAGDDLAWTFEPAEISIAVGERVAFRNDTRATHTADCVDCPWGTGDVQPGETTFVVFEDEGTFAFRCRYHSQLLTGTLVVGDGAPAEDPEPAATPTA